MKHTLQKITTIMVICLFTVFTGCQKDDETVKEKATVNQEGPELISIEEVLAKIKTPKIQNSIQQLKTKSLQKNLDSNRMELEYFEKFEFVEFTQYTLYVSEYSEHNPYYLYYIITIDQNQEERSGFLKYIPLGTSTELVMSRFTGTMQLLTDDMIQHGEVTFNNGQITSNSFTSSGLGTTNCVTEIVIVTHTCSHGGEHLPGQTCLNGNINDAYYSLQAFTDCTTTFDYGTPGNFIGGGGGGSSNTNSFWQIISQDQKNFMTANPSVADKINAWISNGNTSFSVFQKLIDIGRAGRMPLVNLILSYMDNNNYSSKSQVFGAWAITYVYNNPTVTASQFENWFLTP